MFRKYFDFCDFQHRTSSRTSWKKRERAAVRAAPQLLSEMDAPTRRPVTHAMDSAFELVTSLLRSFPHVNYLDFFDYRTDVPWEAFFSLTRSLVTLPTVQHDFSQLRSLDISCNHDGFVQFWPFFTLPNLTLLRLRSALITNLPSWDVELQEWLDTVRQSPVLRLKISNLHIVAEPLRDRDLVPVEVAFKACQQMRHPVLTSRPAGTMALLHTFRQHSETWRAWSCTIRVHLLSGTWVSKWLNCS